MRQRKRKRIRRIVLIAAIAAAACVLAAAWRASGKTTGTEWLLMQPEYVSQLQELADETDDVTALYLSGSISEEDYLSHLSVLDGELVIMEAAYERDEEAADIKNGSHTAASKKGTESVKECFGVFGEMYAVLPGCADDADVLAYTYLAYQQKMADAIAGYETALSVLYLGYGLGDAEY